MKARKVRFSPELEEAIRSLDQNPVFVATGLKYEVGKQVLAILDEKGWSRSDLAKELKKSRQYVTKMLKGYSNFTLDSIAALAIALKKDFHFTFAEPGAEAYLWRMVTHKKSENSKQEEAMYAAPSPITTISLPFIDSPAHAQSPECETLVAGAYP